MRVFQVVAIAATDRGRLLVVRKQGGKQLILPGGKIEDGETDLQALQREIREELALEINADSLTFVGEFHDSAADASPSTVTLRLYRGSVPQRVSTSGEILEAIWFDPATDDATTLAPVIVHYVVPALKTLGSL